VPGQPRDARCRAPGGGGCCCRLLRRAWRQRHSRLRERPRRSSRWGFRRASSRPTGARSWSPAVISASYDTYHSPQKHWIAHKRDAKLHSRSVCSWMCVHRLMKEMQQHQQQQQQWHKPLCSCSGSSSSASYWRSLYFLHGPKARAGPFRLRRMPPQVQLAQQAAWLLPHGWGAHRMPGRACNKLEALS
jgi:hypothetical protein